VKTYSIGFEEEEHSELGTRARWRSTSGPSTTSWSCTRAALELLPRLVWALDEPFADASMMPTFHVAEMARSHVTVALSGDGGRRGVRGLLDVPWARAYARADALPRALRRLAARAGGCCRGPSARPAAAPRGMSVVDATWT
jgi:asparagine synthase (glutamine-hydrolysing)